MFVTLDLSCGFVFFRVPNSDCSLLWIWFVVGPFRWARALARASARARAGARARAMALGRSLVRSIVRSFVCSFVRLFVDLNSMKRASAGLVGD